ncbi:MAG: family transcriptional regulator [Acidimicrobiales bacterium]|nr:family transcriptional regulator [Acidimicrobiales bacterium]
MGRSSRRLASAAEFGRRLRVAREEAALSQMALAEKAGLHFTYVSSVERGERNVSLENILRLAAAAGVDPGELVAGLTPSP